MIDRRRVWFIPPTPPTIEERPATMINKVGTLLTTCIRMRIGATFWTVTNIHPWGQAILFITEGSH